MTIEYFAAQQNQVFVPALAALLVAVIAICLPIVLAPALRRASRGRTRALLGLAAVVAAAALVVTGWQVGVGLRTLQAERASVAARLQERYGLDLSSGDVSELLNGGAPDKAYPELVSSLDLKQSKNGKHPLRLKADSTTESAAEATSESASDSSYELTYGGQPVPPRG